MGTRYLIAVQTDGEYKIAQYGQWDGYPSRQGAKILEFLRSHDLEAFRNQVRKCRWLTPEEETLFYSHPEWPEVYPWLSRDAGSEILNYVDHVTDNLALSNNIEFAQEGLFCEWAYVIDFDAKVFEVWDGFHCDPITDGRLPGPVGGNGYGPVQLVMSWPLDALPDRADFLAAADPDDKEVA
jgi:hypothetical protein